MQRYLGLAIAALLIATTACSSSFAKDHPDLCSEAKIQQVKDAVARGADLAAAASQAGSDPQCLTAEEQQQAQASFAAFKAQQTPSPTPAATTAAPTSAAPSPSASATESPSATAVAVATTAAPTQAQTEAPTQAPTATPLRTATPTPAPTATPAPTTGPGVPGGIPNATGTPPPGFTRYGGTVLDASTGAPIQGVCVYSGPPAGCPQQGTPRTNSAGFFAIDYPAGVTFLWTFEH